MLRLRKGIYIEIVFCFPIIITYCSNQSFSRVLPRQIASGAT